MLAFRSTISSTPREASPVRTLAGLLDRRVQLLLVHGPTLHSGEWNVGRKRYMGLGTSRVRTIWGSLREGSRAAPDVSEKVRKVRNEGKERPAWSGDSQEEGVGRAC